MFKMSFLFSEVVMVMITRVTGLRVFVSSCLRVFVSSCLRD